MNVHVKRYTLILNKYIIYIGFFYSLTFTFKNLVAMNVIVEIFVVYRSLFRLLFTRSEDVTFDVA